MWVEKIVLNSDPYLFGKADRDAAIILRNVRDLQCINASLDLFGA
jgi:hypothetical protein